MTCRFKSCHPHQRVVASLTSLATTFYASQKKPSFGSFGCSSFIAKGHAALRLFGRLIRPNIRLRLLTTFRERSKPSSFGSLRCSSFSPQSLRLCGGPEYDAARSDEFFLRKRSSPESLPLLYRERSRCAAAIRAVNPPEYTPSLANNLSREK